MPYQQQLRKEWPTKGSCDGWRIAWLEPYRRLRWHETRRPEEMCTDTRCQDAICLDTRCLEGQFAAQLRLVRIRPVASRWEWHVL